MGALTVGEHTYGSVARRGDMNEVNIGKFCSIATNVVVDSGFNHETKWISTYPFRSAFGFDVPHNAICKGDINIGNDVWICENVLIMSGVTIGDGAVIGANSIVTKNVQPYQIVAGNPARHIKMRFTERRIVSLLKIEWWNWDINKIQENAHLLMSEDLTKFIELHGNVN
jgi:acetyltransferase-like isoleucine patch superfamily enzyme